MRGEVHIAHIVEELGRDNLLPAIVFRTSRNQCDVDAARAATNKSLRLNPEQQRGLRLCVHEIVKRYEMDIDLITSHPQYNALLSTAIGAHHAGQLLMWRLLLEELMAEGLLRVLVATGTVAAGVDFPARSVVITAHSRRGAEGFMALTASELQQMSGRAGRRGKDTVGFCIAAPAPFCDARQLLKISRQPPEPLRSAYYPSPSTVLNLLRYRNVDDLRFTVERSLASFHDRRDAVELRREADQLETGRARDKADEQSQASKRLGKRIRRIRRQADELELRQLALLDSTLEGLRRLGYVEADHLSEKGFWGANLCTSMVLELGEIIESRMMENASAEKLVAIVAAICGDPHRPYLSSESEVLTEIEIETLTEILERVRSSEIPGLDETRTVLPHAANTALTWMQADDWHQFRSLLILAGVAEGDAARLITQTADHLNQLTRLYDSHRALALRAEEAKRRILRPPLSEALNLELNVS